MIKYQVITYLLHMYDINLTDVEYEHYVKNYDLNNSKNENEKNIINDIDNFVNYICKNIGCDKKIVELVYEEV